MYESKPDHAISAQLPPLYMPRVEPIFLEDIPKPPSDDLDAGYERDYQEDRLADLSPENCDLSVDEFNAVMFGLAPAASISELYRRPALPKQKRLPAAKPSQLSSRGKPVDYHERQVQLAEVVIELFLQYRQTQVRGSTKSGRAA